MPSPRRGTSRRTAGVELRIEGIAGRGSTSTVYRASGVADGRRYALKTVAIRNELDRARVLREAHALRRAGAAVGPGLVALRLGNEVAEFTFDYLDSPCWQRAVDRQESISVADTLRELAAAARAAHALHERGVVHRDLKPLHLLGDARSGVRIIDYGSAWTPEWDRVSYGAVEARGTPGYAAPEQLAGRPVSPASDVYSLGIVALELLSASRPRPGRRWVADALGRVSQQPVEEVLRVATAPGPGIRIPDALLLAEALEAVAAGMSGGDHTARRVNAVPSHPSGSSV